HNIVSRARANSRSCRIAQPVRYGPHRSGRRCCPAIAASRAPLRISTGAASQSADRLLRTEPGRGCAREAADRRPRPHHAAAVHSRVLLGGLIPDDGVCKRGVLGAVYGSQMATVLITQCLQRDFVDPIGPHDPLPNLLHVGYSEAARLLGPEPAAGPLAQLIQWARGLPSDAIDLVHIRDWHDADDPAQHEHRVRFGSHCIKDTVGARLVLEMDERAETAANECIVDSITLNDLEGTDLHAQLDRIRREHGGEPLRVGVIGVWTEAKVSFLLYELRTRLGIEELATCSALTASASRTQHFNALSQLDNILGVNCVDSLADFVDWLRPGAELDLPRHALGFEPRIGGSEAAALGEGDRSIVAHLFRDSTEVDLDPLHGGYSEATVWRAVSRDALGQEHAPAVVKLGPNGSIAQERVAFERVEDVLGNNAPRVRGFVDLAARAGLKYSYAAMGQGGVRTLQSMFAADIPTPQLASLVRTAFEEILGPLYAAARYERLPLFSHYQFSADKAPHVRAAVAALVPDATRPMLEFPGGIELPNVSGF